jgi:hypothetical protein
MSIFKDNVGIDFVDFLIQAVVTGAFMGFVEMTNGPDGLYPVTVGVSVLVLGVRRHFALKRRDRHGLTTGEMHAERVAELEQRVEELESVQARVYELEERLDFTERMLARERSPGALAPPEN